MGVSAEDCRVQWAATVNDIASGMVEYLRAVMETKRQANEHNFGNSRPVDWVYDGMEDFLLQHGRFWVPRPLPDRIARMTPNFCFDNAFKLASRRKNLRYCEGIAAGIIPMHHAWCVDEDNNVIDPTWASTETNVGDAYFGVTFHVTLVRQYRSNDCTAVLNNWTSRFAIYRTPFHGIMP